MNFVVYFQCMYCLQRGVFVVYVQRLAIGHLWAMEVSGCGCRVFDSHPGSPNRGCGIYETWQSPPGPLPPSSAPWVVGGQPLPGSAPSEGVAGGWWCQEAARGGCCVVGQTLLRHFVPRKWELKYSRVSLAGSVMWKLPSATWSCSWLVQPMY